MYNTRRIIVYNIKRLWLEKKESKTWIDDPWSAISLLKEDCSKGTSDTASLLRFGMLYRQIEQMACSDAAYHEILKIDPDNTDAFNGLGWNRLLSSDPAWAAECFQQALKIDPENRFALIHLGWAFFFGMEQEKLIALSEKLLKTLPDETEMYSYLTWTWQWRPAETEKDPARPYRDALLQCCERALEHDAGSFCIHENLGFYYETQEDYQKALRHYEQLAALAPETADSFYGLAHMQLQLVHMDDAVITLRQLLERYPEETEALELLSFLYCLKQDETAAMACMRGLTVDRMDRDTGTCWLWYDSAVHDVHELIQFLELLYRENDENCFLVKMLGFFYEKNGQSIQAQTMFRELTERAPDYTDGWLCLGKTQIENGDIYGALDTAFRSGEAGRSNRIVLWKLGDMLAEEGYHNEAIPLYDQLIEMCAEGEDTLKAKLLCCRAKAELAAGSFE